MLRWPLLIVSLTVDCLIAGVLSAGQGQAAFPKTYVVDTNVSDPSGTMNGCDFPNLTVDCSLVGAIKNANASPNSILGPDEIFFSVSTGYVFFYPGTAELPQITEAVDIDATGQPPGAESCGPGTTPCVQIDGSQVTGESHGFDIAASGVTIRGFAIHGFNDGIYFTSGASGLIAGNYIGLLDGTDASPNHRDGIVVSAGVSNVRIGGTTLQDRNLISANASHGIYIAGTNNTVEGNYIGTNSAGDAPLGNVNVGIYIDDGGNNNTIGGSDDGSGNLISGNGFDDSPGVLVAGNTNSVFGNLIGTNAAGDGAIANHHDGILVTGLTHDNQIGGPGSERNVISGNSSVGLRFEGNDFTNQVNNNYIGVNQAGDAAVPNGADGINFYISGLGFAQHNTLYQNVISGNHGNGIQLVALGLGVISMNTFSGNIIGQNAAGDAAIPNDGDGIHMSETDSMISQNLIGPQDANPGNVIRNNGGYGIVIDGAGGSNNHISTNFIDDNGQLGIRLLNGANNNQSAPVLAAGPDSGTPVTGTISGTGNAMYTVELFASPACDPSGNGEGRVFFDTESATTDGGGVAQFSVTSAPASQKVTATVTDPDGNTSEFSNCVTPTGPTPTPSPTPSPTHSPTPTPTPSHTPTPTGTAGAALLGDGDCDGHITAHDVLAALSETASVDPGAACAERADTDCDGDVDASDALRILLFVAGTPMTPASGCGQVGSPA